MLPLKRPDDDLLRLADMAHSAKGARPDEVYRAVGTLFERQQVGFSPRERALAADILRRLTKDVEMSIRIGVAERMADIPDAPHELVLLLANDCIEVARPILARSPVLSDADLVELVQAAGFAHEVAIAERPYIGITVSAALVRSQCEAALIALLRNPTSRISELSFEHLLERARAAPALQGALAERSDLPARLANDLYGWVSAGLKTALARRYPQLASRLSDAIDDSISSLLELKREPQDESAALLIEKLHASGQLGASFLVRVLRQGHLDLFEHGCAVLLGLDVGLLRKELGTGAPGMLALICRAVGIDRAVFPTLYALRHADPAAQLTEADRHEIEAAFAEPSRASALVRIKGSALL